MNPSYGVSLARMMQVVSKGIQTFIGPAHLQCCCCGEAKRISGWNPLGVCQTCLDGFPWITDVVCPICGRGEACPDCLRQEQRYLARNRSAVRYDEAMKELLARYKYRSDERLQQLMGRMLVHAYRLYPKTGGAGSPFDYISYVPVSSERYEERGFNQAEQMALVVAGQVNLPVVSLLARTRHTDKQSFKSRKERADNLQGAFAVIPGRAAKLQAHAKRRDLRILLVDDVYTTGSTLNQCALELRRELPAAQVYGLCWAR